MQYKLQHSWSVNQEDTTLDVISERLSPRSQKLEVTSHHTVQVQRRKRNINM